MNATVCASTSCNTQVICSSINNLSVRNIIDLNYLWVIHLLPLIRNIASVVLHLPTARIFILRIDDKKQQGEVCCSASTIMRSCLLALYN